MRFAIPPGRRRELCVPTTPDERALLRARPDSGRAPSTPVPLDIVITSDPRGESEMSHGRMLLDAGRSRLDPSLVLASGCSADVRRQLARERARAVTATPLRVVDGDTLVVHGTPAGQQLVRLLGIDAPAARPFAEPVCGQREATERLLQEALLRSGWVTTERAEGEPLEHAADLRRAALAGRRVERNVHTAC